MENKKYKGNILSNLAWLGAAGVLVNLICYIYQWHTIDILFTSCVIVAFALFWIVLGIYFKNQDKKMLSKEKKNYVIKGILVMVICAAITAFAIVTIHDMTEYVAHAELYEVQ